MNRCKQAYTSYLKEANKQGDLRKSPYEFLVNFLTPTYADRMSLRYSPPKLQDNQVNVSLRDLQCSLLRSASRIGLKTRLVLRARYM